MGAAAVSAGLGAAIPVGLLLAYNVATTGHVFHPAYDYLYQLEANGYPALGYHPDWAHRGPALPPAEPRDHVPRRRPRSRRTACRDTLGDDATPVCTDPGATRGLFDVDVPARASRATSG